MQIERDGRDEYMYYRTYSCTAEEWMLPGHVEGGEWVWSVLRGTCVQHGLGGGQMARFLSAAHCLGR
jgi:hypothetical protein